MTFDGWSLVVLIGALIGAGFYQYLHKDELRWSIPDSPSLLLERELRERELRAPQAGDNVTWKQNVRETDFVERP